MSDNPPIFLKRNRATAAEVERILRLPDQRWGSVAVQFGHDGIATATVEFLLTGPQLEALATLAAEPPATVPPRTDAELVSDLQTALMRHRGGFSAPRIVVGDSLDPDGWVEIAEGYGETCGTLVLPPELVASEIVHHDENGDPL